ncbi:MAG: hypothetical protein JXB07_13555 [Anaerolineae bacterium]|nr:hypothetical protein [Anaerolineae bacterium]
MYDHNIEDFFQYKLAGPRVFRPAIIPALLPVGAAIIIVLVLAGITSDPSDRDWIWIAAGLFLGVFVVVAIIVRLVTLTLSLEGLTYNTLVYRVHANWSDLSGVTTTIMGSRSVESIVTRHPVVEGGFWLKILPLAWFTAVLTGNLSPFDSGNRKDLIPVSIFDNNWRAGEIGTLVGHFAPQALRNDESDRFTC